MSIAGSSKNHPEYNAGDHLNPAVTNEGVSFPVSVQPNILATVRSSLASQLSAMAGADLGTKGLQPQSHVAQTKPRTGEFTALNDKIKEQELSIEGGTISISAAYSRG